MGLFVKICGIRSGEILERICALGPDAVGFVFWPKSVRFVEPERVGAWETPPGVRRVGVFVDPTEEEAAAAAEAARLDVIQLHRLSPGRRYDPARLPEGIRFWVALNGDELQDETPPAFAFPVEAMLLDSYDPRTVGGTGRTCDWDLAARIARRSPVPVILAGGLTPENVRRAVEVVRPWGVDVSSGVERAPGEKDLDKVRSFISACRNLPPTA